MSHDFLPHYEWAAALGAFLLLWCLLWVKPRFGALSASLLGYLGLNTLWVWVWVENRYVTLNPYDQMALRYFSADSLARLLIILVPLMLLCEKKATLLFFGEMGVKTFVVLNSLWAAAGLFLGGCSGVNTCGGAGNPSIMMGLTVCALPIVIKSWRQNWLTLLLSFVAVLAAKSSVAYGLMGIYLAYSVYCYRPKLIGLALCVSTLPLIIASFLLVPGELFNSSDRFLLWQYIMPKWAAPQNVLFGTGLGTYHVFSIHLQNIPGIYPVINKDFWWDSLHNDWLQMLFEGGVAGAVLIIGTYMQAIYRLLKSRQGALAMSGLLFGIYMTVNPALHHALPALFGAWLFVYALKREGFQFPRPHHYY